LKSYEEFRLAVRQRESSNRYAEVNRFGYLGAYQFGLARLCDLGLTRRKIPGSSLANENFAFTSITREEFLGSPGLQDACFDLHVQRLKFICLKKAPDLSSGVLIPPDFTLDLSGGIMVCHLLGPGGLTDFIQGVSQKDALGTSARDYAFLFHDYEIPK
jgi:hypothetical protein